MSSTGYVVKYIRLGPDTWVSQKKKTKINLDNNLAFFSNLLLWRLALFAFFAFFRSSSVLYTPGVSAPARHYVVLP